ncbi:hypothetical protein [Williamsia sterculiae]|uniref:Uncharacterized protein n=1 Tax=Williamsia sterculiae TaxID=1344003 RepID=A0A1N7G7Z3_9NOCA|nr:hypothetical protein [Williamsia sterculiae]SIS08717.1 hypothetical protein SAMN05445060_2585 [Williamsia sterculiae]
MSITRPTATTISATSTAPPRSGTTTMPTRAVGVALVGTTIGWGTAMQAIGGREGFGWYSLLGGVAALAFQATLIVLLLLECRTHAMGSGRVARTAHRVQFAVMAGAMVSTVLDAFWALHGTVIWMVFDSCWPLSMVGMAAIGIRIVIAGRWSRPLRWQTLFAQSWVLWAIPLSAVPMIGMVGGLLQILLGYGVLGLMLFRVGRLPITPA